MSCSNYRFGCIGLAFVASLIIGILTAVFRYIAVITVTPAFLWVLFGIAVGFLGITLLTGGGCDSACARESYSAFLTGILCTVLTSVILLGITFAATSIIGAIITGALLFFFSFMIISAACLLNCSCNN